MKAGQINSVSPQYLFFPIWETTRHDANFDTQIKMLLPEKKETRFATAE